MLRIGRTKAYDLAKEWRATDGASGLPVVDEGNKLMAWGAPQVTSWYKNEAGRVTAVGTHSELLGSSAHYRFVISSLEDELKRDQEAKR